MLFSLKVLVFYFVVGLALCAPGDYMDSCACKTDEIVFETPPLQDGEYDVASTELGGGIPYTNQQGCCNSDNLVCVSTLYTEEANTGNSTISDFKCYPLSSVTGTKIEEYANYKGDYLLSEDSQDTLEDCQKNCEDTESCNVFVYCGVKAGCKNADVNVIPFKTCDLKISFAVKDGSEVEAWGRGPNVDFTSGTVNRSIPCGTEEGAPCCASVGNLIALEQGLDPLMFPGGCSSSDDTLYCDLSAADTSAEFGVCKTIDLPTDCGTEFGLCDQQCSDFTSTCPDGFTCTYLRTDGIPGYGNQFWGINQCVKTPKDDECGENGQMCCPGALPGTQDDRVTASCKGDNSLCEDAGDFYSGKCWDYDLCGEIGGECCPNLPFKVSSGTAEDKNLDQCRGKDPFCSGADISPPNSWTPTGPPRICKENAVDCGTKGNLCCFSSPSAAFIQPTCSDGSTCSDEWDSSGTATCQA